MSVGTSRGAWTASGRLDERGAQFLKGGEEASPDVASGTGAAVALKVWERDVTAQVQPIDEVSKPVERQDPRWFGPAGCFGPFRAAECSHLQDTPIGGGNKSACRRTKGLAGSYCRRGPVGRCRVRHASGIRSLSIRPEQLGTVPSAAARLLRQARTGSCRRSRTGCRQLARGMRLRGERTPNAAGVSGRTVSTPRG